MLGGLSDILAVIALERLHNVYPGLVLRALPCSLGTGFIRAVKCVIRARDFFREDLHPNPDSSISITLT